MSWKEKVMYLVVSIGSFFFNTRWRCFWKIHWLEYLDMYSLQTTFKSSLYFYCHLKFNMQFTRRDRKIHYWDNFFIHLIIISWCQMGWWADFRYSRTLMRLVIRSRTLCRFRNKRRRNNVKENKIFMQGQLKSKLPAPLPNFTQFSHILQTPFISQLLILIAEGLSNNSIKILSNSSKLRKRP